MKSAGAEQLLNAFVYLIEYGGVDEVEDLFEELLCKDWRNCILL